VGFRVVERLAERHGRALDEERFRGRFGRVCLERPADTEGRGADDPGGPGPGRPVTGEAPGRALEVGVLAPLTFMNRSGAALSALLKRHPDLSPAHVLVVFDDLDLPFGRLRLRRGGGSGGHNGLGDILRVLGTRDVPRLRFGIGRPPAGADPVEYVLSPFCEEERRRLGPRVDRAAQAVEDALVHGVERAMNRVNRSGSDGAGEEAGPPRA